MSRIRRQKSRLPPRLRKRSDFFSTLLERRPKIEFTNVKDYQKSVA
jgi:hypothetical protein